MTKLQKDTISVRTFEKALRTVVEEKQNIIKQLAEKWNNTDGFNTLEEAQQACFKIMNELKKSNTFTMRFDFNEKHIIVYPYDMTAHPAYRLIYTGHFIIDIKTYFDGYNIECEWNPAFRVFKEDI